MDASSPLPAERPNRGSTDPRGRDDGEEKHPDYRNKIEILIVAAAESNKTVVAKKWKAGKMAERAKTVQ